MANGINSGVSSDAKPNIRPWSPAPCSLNRPSPAVTPIEMSGDCLSSETSTAQVPLSNPISLSVYPIDDTVLRTTLGISTIALVVISPATMTRPVVTKVSHATRERGSCSIMESRTASEILSATLSGCPSVTDSEENK